MTMMKQNRRDGLAVTENVAAGIIIGVLGSIENPGTPPGFTVDIVTN